MTRLVEAGFSLWSDVRAGNRPILARGEVRLDIKCVRGQGIFVRRRPSHYTDG